MKDDYVEFIIRVPAVAGRNRKITRQLVSSWATLLTKTLQAKVEKDFGCPVKTELTWRYAYRIFDGRK